MKSRHGGGSRKGGYEFGRSSTGPTNGDGRYSGGHGVPAHRAHMKPEANRRNFANGDRVDRANISADPVMRGGMRF